MGLLINEDDFASLIATDVYTEADLTLAIDEYENPLLYELLGIELYNLFVADLVNGVPQTAKYLTIYNAFVKEIDDKMVTSQGMKEMLVQWVFFYFVRTQPQSNSIGGNVENQDTINKPSEMSYTTLVLKYNKCITNFKSIQTYIKSVKDTDYSTYKGICKEYMSWA